MFNIKYKRFPAVVSIILAGLLIVSPTLFASVAGNFSVTDNGNYEVGPSDTNQLTFQVDLPDPNGTDTSIAGVTVAGTQGTATFPASWSLFGFDAAAGAAFNAAADWIGTDDDSDGVYTSAADSLIINNSDAPSAGNTLYDMAATDYYMDSDHGASYNNSEAWVLDDGDGFLTAGALNGTGTDDVLFDGPADILAFQTEFCLDDSATNDGDYNDGELIIGDNGNSQPDSGDTIFTAGKADVTNFQASDGVLFDNSDLGNEFNNGVDDLFIDEDQDDVYTSAVDSVGVNGTDNPSDGDTLYDVTTADNLCTDNTDLDSATCIYVDTDGTPCDATTGGETYYLGAVCTAGTDTEVLTGDNWATTDDTIDGTTDIVKEETAEELTYSGTVDFVLYNGSGTLSAGDAGRDIINDPEVIYLDSNHDTVYANTEPLVDVGDGNTLADDGDVALTHSFLDRASGSWSADIIDMLTDTLDLGHVDVDNNGGYDDGEPIIREVSGTIDANLESTDTVVTTGTSSILTAFPVDYAKTDSTSDSSTDVYDEETQDEHTYSAGADTLVGGVVVSAGSTLVNMNSAKPGNWSALLINDAGGVGTWESGSDMIFNDDDTSTYYNADDLTSIVINNTGTCVDADLTAIRIWEDTDGNNTFNSGSDTQIGADTSTPYINQTITTGTSTVYTSANNFRTIFATVDIAAAPTDGCTFIAQIPTNGVVLLSNNDGPTDSAVATTDTLTVDSQVTVTDGAISITSNGTGTAGVEQYIIGDTLVVQWNDSGAGDNNGDIVGTPTVDFTAFDGGGAVAMEDDGAGGACNDGGNGDNVWCAAYTIVAGSVDSNVVNNLNVSVSATDDQSNNATQGDTTGLDCDDIAPNITANGTLTITTDNGTGGVAAVNGGAVNPDKVTQSAVTLSVGDSDTTTTNFTALTGEGAITAGVESGNVTAGALDNAAQTFTITVTDNAGNTDTAASDAINVDNTLPNITANGTLTITTDNGTVGVAAMNGGAVNPDKVTQSAVALSAPDGDSTTIDITGLTGQGALAASVESGNITAGVLDNAAQTFTITVTDNASNLATTASDTISVDNIAPTIGAAGTIGLTDTSGEGVASIGENLTYAAGTPGADDGDSWMVDLSDYALSGTQAPGAVAVVADNDDGAFSGTETVTDNGGNIVTGAATITGGFTIDNIAPTLNVSNLTISTDGGVGGVAAVNGGGTPADQVNINATVTAADGDTITWDASAIGGGATSVNNTPVVVAAGVVDNATYAFNVTATDNGGNPVTTDTNTIDGDNISLDNDIPVVTAARVTATGCSGTGGACKNGDTPTLNWLGDTDGETDTVASATFDGSNFRAGDTALAAADPGTPGTNDWSVGLSGALSAQDDAANTVDVTVVDNAGNSVSATSAVGYIVDTNVPTVTAANITVTGCAGTGGACKNGDTPTLNWLGDTDGETDTIASATFDGSNFRGVDGALAGGDPGTPGTNDWTASLSGALDAQDDVANTVDVTVVDNAGNTSGAVTSAVGYIVDTNVPTITDNGSLTITTDGGTAALCEVGDKVTQTAATVAAADGDTTTINLNAPNNLTGEAALVATTESVAAIAGGLDNAAMTFTVTATDNAGNTDTTASDAIAVYTVAAGALTTTSVTLSNAEVNQNTTFSVAFTTTTNWAADGLFEITFPAEFDVSGLDTQTATTLSNVDGVLTAAVVGQVVTLTRDGSGTQTAGGAAVSFDIATGTNGGTAGVTGTFVFETQNSTGGILDEDTSVAGVTLTAAPAGGGTTGGGPIGGGGGGGGSSTDPTSNTSTSSTASTIQDTITIDYTYNRPLQLNDEMITTDEETGDKSALLTGEDAEIVIQPNSESTISVTIPPNTTVTGTSDWDGKISPPIISSVTVINQSGEAIEGLDEELTRDNVDVVVRIGSTNSPLILSNPVLLEIPTDLPDGTSVRILFSPDSDSWEDFGVVVVENGVIQVLTYHFSYFAASAELADVQVSVEEGLLFQDISGHWAENYINQIAELEIVSGKSEGVFAPDDEITRAELTKIAVNAFGFEPPAPENITEESFTDVDIFEWYAPYIQVAKENGLVEGYGDEFRPNVSINRAEALKILLGAADFDVTGEITASFDDTDDTAWYMGYVNFAANNNIVSGYGDGTFGPENNITRAEVSKVIVLAMDLLET